MVAPVSVRSAAKEEIEVGVVKVYAEGKAAFETRYSPEQGSYVPPPGSAS
jgi:hypothetical protein